MKRLGLTLLAVAFLTACGEASQSAKANKHDAAAYSGAAQSFTSPGWTVGDKTSWDSQLKVRAQYGQDDFSRMP
jgi:hypothetical protein